MRCVIRSTARSCCPPLAPLLTETVSVLDKLAQHLELDVFDSGKADTRGANPYFAKARQVELAEVAAVLDGVDV